ncbi:FHA domain-containing protein [bacterium]|nr:FHA domain-containing protein [bacterium]
MYRLTVVAGPNRGTSYPLSDGETTMGRLSLNSIVLNSSKVSKRHCSLVVSNGEVICKDQGSSNGTFVNGVLSKVPRQVRSGDRISVGDFVFELALVQADVVRDAVALPSSVGGMGGQVIPFPGAAPAPQSGVPGLIDLSESASSVDDEVMPRDFKSSLLWIFERRLMPYLYQFLLKVEWRNLVFGSYFLLTLIAIVFAVFPAIQAGDELVIRELQRRGRLMARLIVESNIPYIANKAEARSEIPEAIAKGSGVLQAYLTDLDGRFLAPAARLNQYVTSGASAVVLTKARAAFLNGQVDTFIVPGTSSTLVAVEPMFIYSPKESKNIPVAMGVVTLDSGIAVHGIGKTAVIVSEALLWLAFFAVILALAVYRLTLKPLEIINNQIDRTLKGDLREEFSRECKFEELSGLQDMIEALLRRAASAQLSESRKETGTSSISIADECLYPFRTLGEQMAHGMAFCDSERRLLFMNSSLEELSGIRSDNGMMQNLPDQARDQAFASLLNDLFDRAGRTPEGASEEFEFSGVPYRIQMVAVGVSSSSPRGYVLITTRSENG